MNFFKKEERRKLTVAVGLSGPRKARPIRGTPALKGDPKLTSGSKPVAWLLLGSSLASSQVVAGKESGRPFQHFGAAYLGLLKIIKHSTWRKILADLVSLPQGKT